MQHDALLAKYGTGKNGHSHFAPSSAAGWLNCAGFLLVNARGADTGGEDAAYGTVAHDLAHLWHQTKKRPTDRIGKDVTIGQHCIVIDKAMLDYVGQYVAWCNEAPGEHFYEQRVDLSAFMPIPGQGGTADHFALSPGHMTITDLKMGTGVFVPVENNYQAMLYALGVFDEWDWAYGFETITIRICQPRLNYFGTWTITRQELLSFGMFVRDQAARAWDENAPRAPSEKACRWCAANGKCAAQSLLLDMVADASFEPLDDPEALLEFSHEDMVAYADQQEVIAEVGLSSLADPATMNTASLTWRLGHRKLFEKWFKLIYNELLSRAEKGEHLPRWKLSKGRYSYHWIDLDNAAHEMVRAGIDDPYETRLISVAEARKALAASGLSKSQVEALLEPIVDARPGKRTLKPLTDTATDVQDSIDNSLTAEDDDDDL